VKDAMDNVHFQFRGSSFSYRAFIRASACS
jgi:hypothetical protein